MTSDLDLQLTEHKPSLVDKTFLVGRKIKVAYKLGKNAVLFVCERKEPHLMLRCSSNNSTVYMRIDPQELPMYLTAFKTAQRQL